MKTLVLAAVAAVLLAGCSAVDALPSPTAKTRPVAAVGPTLEALAGETSASPSPITTPVDPAKAQAAVDEAAEEYAKALFTSTNAARETAGQPALLWNDCAADLAGDRVGDAIALVGLRVETVDHTCTERRVGEAMARNFGTAESMFAAWMANVDLKQNVLRPEYTRSGVGCLPYSSEDEHVPATTPEDVGGYVCSEVFLRIVP